MKRILVAILLALVPLVALGQIVNAPALIGQRGTALPANCQVGQLFFKSDAVAGVNVYGCTAVNTWTIQGGAGSSPGGSAGNLQTNDGAGGFGAYAGASCTNQFPRALDASGAATCASVTLGTDTTGTLALSSLGAATGATTLASGNNHSQVWNWTLTSNSVSALSLGETVAATNGTASAGIPNQVIAKFSTLASSTASPLSVYSQGSHVFSVSSTAAQVLAADGSVTAPTYAFAGASGTGISRSGGSLIFSIGGTETFRTVSSTPKALQFSAGSNDTQPYVYDVRKARGTVASPTVITSGDDVWRVTGYGYVGSTNTYQNMAEIRFDSAGTISDATNGIGGEIYFATKKQGANTSVVDRAKFDQAGHLVTIAGTGNTPSMGTCGSSPSVAGTDTAMLVTVGTGGAATSCAVNFGTAWGTAPVCIAQNNTDKVAYSISTSTSAVTITAAAAFTASSKFYVLCTGY